MLFKLRKTELFIALMLLGFLGILCQKFFLLPPLSADSWSYFELSKTIFFEFYKFSTYRSYENFSSYGSSFPPLWPIFIATFNAIFNQGPRAGMILNFILMPFIVISLERLSRDIFKFNYLGLITFLICLSDVSFIDEVLGGRAIPLQILILLNLLIALLGLNRVSVLSAFAKCGVLLGLGLLNRFDAVAIMPVIFGFVLLIKPDVKRLVAFVLAFLFSISPWVTYSFLYFNTLWKTDNGLVAAAIEKVRVTDWYPGPIVTLREDFLGWLEKVLLNVYPLIQANLLALWGLAPSFGAVCAGGLIIFSADFLFRKRKASSEFESQRIEHLGKFSSLFALMSLFSFVPNAVTGYFDWRYFAFHRMIFIALGLGIMVKRLRGFVFESSLMLIFCVPVLLLMANYKLPEIPISAEPNPLNPAWVEEIHSCLETEKKFKSILFIDIYNPSYSPFQFGALTGLRTGCSPENFDSLKVQEQSLFLKSFDFSHVFSAKDISSFRSELGVTFVRSECSNMIYAIKFN